MWFEPAPIDSLVELVPPWLALLLALLSFLGSAALLTPLLVVWYAVKPRERVLAWIGLLFSAFALRAFLKGLNDIPRPTAEPTVDLSNLPWFLEPLYRHPVGIDTTGFPSGHMVAAIVFWGILAVDVTYGTRTQRGVIAAVIVSIVAITRLFLGAHWTADIVVGAGIGILLLIVFLWGRAVVGDSVVFAFGLAGTIGGIDLLVVGTLSGHAVFAAAWGLFVGLAIQSWFDWPATSSIDPRSGALATIAVIAGIVALGVSVAAGSFTAPILLVVCPVVALAIHWHPARLKTLQRPSPAIDGR